MTSLEPLDISTMTKAEAEEVVRAMLYPWERHVPLTLGAFSFRWFFYSTITSVIERASTEP